MKLVPKNDTHWISNGSRVCEKKEGSKEETGSSGEDSYEKKMKEKHVVIIFITVSYIIYVSRGIKHQVHLKQCRKCLAEKF